MLLTWALPILAIKGSMVLEQKMNGNQVSKTVFSHLKSVFFFSRATKQCRPVALIGRNRAFVHAWTSLKCVTNTAHFCYGEQSVRYSKHTNINAICLSSFLFLLITKPPYCQISWLSGEK